MSVKKYLITGIAGFVGTHFLSLLDQKNSSIEVVGVDVIDELKPKTNNIDFKYICLDLSNKDKLSTIIENFKPDYILHLASYSSVAYSWKDPVNSFINNVNIFLNLLEAVKQANHKCRILSIGSSEEYAQLEEPSDKLSETYTLEPSSPYSVARISQEMLGQVYIDGYGLDIVCTRSFNHTGPGQTPTFVIPSFINKAIEEVKNNTGKKEITIETGNIDIIRDFSDVRDVVKAYDLLLTKESITGKVFNVCSSKGHSLRDILDIIGNKLEVKISSRVNPSFLRSNDREVIVGDNSLINKELGWKPTKSLKSTIEDMIDEILIK